MDNQDNLLKDIAVSLTAISHDIEAYGTILVFVIAALKESGLDPEKVAGGLKSLATLQPVQQRIDAFADALSFANQYKPTSPGLRLVEGGKNDVTKADDEPA